MAKPTTREEFKQFCLRALGAPVIELNLADEQIEDRIDVALSYYADYHFDGSERMYYKHQLSQTDIDNKYIMLPENIIGAVRLFKISDMNTSSEYMFNIRYQIALNDLYTLTNVSLIPYFMAMQHLELIEELLVPEALIRYSRHKNILYCDMDWNRVNPGTFILVEAHEVIDPEIYQDVWKDRWLQEYTVALIKLQWGGNITKWSSVPMPSGMTLNSEFIYNEGKQEKQRLEDEMKTGYSLPPLDLIG